MFLPMMLTQATVNKLALPTDKTDAIYFDDDLPGLGLRLRAGGSRSWIFQYQIGAKQRRVSLGNASAITLAEARKAASGLQARVEPARGPKHKNRRRAPDTFEKQLKNLTEQVQEMKITLARHDATIVRYDLETRLLGAVDALLAAKGDEEQAAKEHLRAVRTSLLPSLGAEHQDQAKAAEDEPPPISESAAARLLGVSADTLRRMSVRGEGPPRIKLSLRRVGYRLANCLAFLKAREVAPKEIAENTGAVDGGAA
jgi:hypothetical protein